MQATDAHHAGVEGLEASALAWGRQHSEATVRQYYSKPSHKRMSTLAESALAVVRGGGGGRARARARRRVNEERVGRLAITGLGR